MTCTFCILQSTPGRSSWYRCLKQKTTPHLQRLVFHLCNSIITQFFKPRILFHCTTVYKRLVCGPLHKYKPFYCSEMVKQIGADWVCIIVSHHLEIKELDPGLQGNPSYLLCTHNVLVTFAITKNIVVGQFATQQYSDLKFQLQSSYKSWCYTTKRVKKYFVS